MLTDCSASEGITGAEGGVGHDYCAERSQKDENSQSAKDWNPGAG